MPYYLAVRSCPLLALEVFISDKKISEDLKSQTKENQLKLDRWREYEETKETVEHEVVEHEVVEHEVVEHEVVEK